MHFSPIKVLILVLYIPFLGAISNSKARHVRFSTKSSYNSSVLFDIRDGIFDNQNTTLSPQCSNNASVMFVTTVFRHGTRYPGLKDVKNARILLKKLKEASIDSKVHDRLNKILNQFPDDNNKDLAPSGFLQNIELGRRFGKKYNHLFSDASEKDLHFYVTSKNRTKLSFEGFYKGFKKALHYDFAPMPEIRDDLLRFFDKCKKYIHDVDKNKATTFEAKQYMIKKHNKLTKLIENATKTRNLNLTFDELDSLIDVSGCEDAVFDTGYWADILPDKAFDILNYVSDLEDYWRKGPGYSISYEQGCVLMSQIFKEMDEIIAGHRSGKGTYYFSHAETLYPLFGLLGIFRDKEPLYHNNSQLHKNRSFMSSRINPFSSNIAFVLHNCSGEIFIELQFKEHPLNWPQCDNSLCPYDVIRSNLTKYIDYCNFEDMCEDSYSRRNVEL